MSLSEGDDLMQEKARVKDNFLAGDAPELFPQLFPGVMHFNCQGGKSVWENAENMEANTSWGPMVQTLVTYKWVWLNRGDGSAKVDISTVNVTHFLDEIRFPQAALESQAPETTTASGMDAP